MLRTIHLHGALGTEFGPLFRLDVRSPAEGIRALCAQLPGMQRRIAEGGAYRVVIGKRLSTGRRVGVPARDVSDETPITPHLESIARDLNAPWRDGEADLHLVPVASGRKAGTGKIIIGVIIMVVAIVGAVWTGGGSLALTSTAFSLFGAEVTYGMIAMAGAMIALGGIAMMMSPQAKTGSYAEREDPDQRASYLFNSVVNTVEQGGPVPLIYGKTMVGSQVIALGLSPEDIPYVDTDTDTTKPPGFLL